RSTRAIFSRPARAIPRVASRPARVFIGAPGRGDDGGKPVIERLVYRERSRGGYRTAPFSCTSGAPGEARPVTRNRRAIRGILTRGAEFFCPSFANNNA